MATKSKKKDAVSTTSKNTALIPEVDYGDLAGDGFEGTTKEDYAIPFLELLQNGSKKLNELEDGHAGMMIDTVSKDLYPIGDGVKFIPVCSEHKFVEWIPRDKGGGYVASYDVTDPVVIKAKETAVKFGSYETESGNDLVETFYVYGSLVEGGAIIKDMMIAFKSSHIGAYRNWRSLAKQAKVRGAGNKVVTPPFYSHVFLIKAFLDTSNNKGDFFNFSISWDGDNHVDCLLTPDSEMFQYARDFKLSVQQGDAKVDYSGQEETAGSESTAEDNIPF